MTEEAQLWRARARQTILFGQTARLNLFSSQWSHSQSVGLRRLQGKGTYRITFHITFRAEWFYPGSAKRCVPDNHGVVYFTLLSNVLLDEFLSLQKKCGLNSYLSHSATLSTWKLSLALTNKIIEVLCRQERIIRDLNAFLSDPSPLMSKIVWR